MTAPPETTLTEAVPPPPDDDAVIWRYMDFTKLVALLETRTLFFPRVSALEDPFEGAFPRTQPLLERMLSILPVRLPPDAVVHMSPGLETIGVTLRKWTYVSCWHISAHESAAMWKLYAPTSAAIAVQSTVGRLRAALGLPPPMESGFFGSTEFHLGTVEYIDYGTGTIPSNSFAAQFFRKRKSFEHEKELRALLMRYPVDGKSGIRHDIGPGGNGAGYPVRLESLIEAVRVAPQSPPWYFALVAKVAARYGIKCDVMQSALDAEPMY